MGVWRKDWISRPAVELLIGPQKVVLVLVCKRKKFRIGFWLSRLLPLPCRMLDSAAAGLSTATAAPSWARAGRRGPNGRDPPRAGSTRLERALPSDINRVPRPLSARLERLLAAWQGN